MSIEMVVASWLVGSVWLWICWVVFWREEWLKMKSRHWSSSEYGQVRPPPGYGQVRVPGYKYGYDHEGNLVLVVLTVNDELHTVWGSENTIPHLVLQSEGRWMPVS